MKKFVNRPFILSATFFSIFVAIFVIDQFGLFERFTTVEIVVASQEIDRDHEITDEDVTLLKIDKEYYREDMFKEKEKVIGKVTTQVINPIEHISTKHFDSSILKPTPENEFFPIPDEWLIEIQGTLRRYDLVNVTAVFDSEKNEMPITTLSNTERVLSEFVLTNVPVAFVKSNNNEEITGETSGEDRLKGTDTPSSIELSLTLEQFKQLEKLYAQGYRFILSYR